MPALVHTSFRVSNAKQFRESFLERTEHGVGGYIPLENMAVDSQTGELSVTSAPSLTALNKIPYYAMDDQMYLFIGRVTAWGPTDTPDGSIDPNINENNPPNPVDSVKDAHFNHWDDMIAAKKVSSNEVSHVVKRERADEINAGVRNWRLGLKYDGYDDRADNQFDDDVLIHTVNNRFRVYKAIKQGVGRFVNANIDGTTQYIWDYSSYREPLNFVMEGGVSEDFMVVDNVGEGQFNDGYQWKYYYTIDAGEALKFVTTSYIPVRTIRKENGSRTNDFSDQYNVEGASIPGGILNTLVLKTPVESLDGTLYGYEPTGGDGYYQMGFSESIVSYQGGAANTLTFTVDIANITACDWPDVNVAVTHANADVTKPYPYNIFDFTTGKAGEAVDASYINQVFADYGVVIKSSNNTNLETFKKYVFPISSVQRNINTLVFTIDANTLPQLIGTSTSGVTGLPNSVVTATTDSTIIEVHPRIHIEPNHQSTNITDPIDGFYAYGIVEPLFDSTTRNYLANSSGRIIDTRVTNPGRYNYRIDSTKVMPDVSAAGYAPTGPLNGPANAAKVHACIPPVGGHGFDPVSELGGFNVMINARFEGTESDEFTVGNEFRKIGILKNPLSYDSKSDLNELWLSQPGVTTTYNEWFREFKTDQCYRINLANDSAQSSNTANEIFFEPDMIVAFYANSGNINSVTTSRVYAPGEMIATAKLVDHDTVAQRIRVIKPRKDFLTVLNGGDMKVESLTLHSVQNDNVFAYTTSSNTATTPGMMPGSGQILYVENRSMVSRSQNQTEDLKISIQF